MCIRDRFDGVEEVVTSGHMVLYQPKEIQNYVYYVEDHPEVFWIHFTGYDVKNIPVSYTHLRPLRSTTFAQRTAVFAPHSCGTRYCAMLSATLFW